jgi:hypothetical protein
MRKVLDIKSGKKGAFWLAAIIGLNVFAFPAADRAIRQGALEFTLGSYSMNEPRFKAVYPEGGLMAGLTFSSTLFSNLNLYLDLRYYSRQGELTFSQEKTKFYMVPLDIGVRYIFPLGTFHPYLGAGLDFYFYYEDNAIGTALNSADGYHIMGGLYFRFAKGAPILLNLRVKHTWARAEEDAIAVQLGGLEYGAGLTFVF